MSSRLRMIALNLAAALLAAATVADAAVTPQQQCQAAKNKVAGAYATCRQKAEAGLATSGDATKYGAALGKCGTKLTTAWQKAIDKAAKAGATCLDAPLAVGDFQTVIDNHTDGIATALGGGGLPECPADLATCTADLAACEAASDCGNGIVDRGEACDGAALGGKTCASFGGSDFPGLACTSACSFDFVGCAYAAATPARFHDNGDQTATDLWTGLVWEMKTGTPGPFVLCPDLATCPNPHDVNNDYHWTATGTAFDGTAKAIFLDVLNDVAGGGASCFAGHCDWRLPSGLELKGILLEPEAVMTCGTTPCIDPSFPGPTGTGGYWSANTSSDGTTSAYYVRFDGGGLFPTLKTANRYARAVRGGS